MRRKYRIGIVAPSLGRNGGVRRLIEIANRLHERDHKVTLFSDYSAASMLRIRCPRKKFADLKRERLDVLCVGWPRFNADRQWIYNAGKARLKLWFMQAYYGKEDRRFLQDDSFIKIAFSSHMYNVGKELGADPIKAIGGINFEHFYPMKLPRDTMLYRQRRSLHIEDYSNFNMEQIYKDLGYKKIKLLKHYNALGVIRFYNSGKVFVSSEAHFAGWANPIVEAMACRAVAISDWTPAADDLIIPGETGLRYKNAEEVKEVIRKVMRDHGFRRQIQNNAEKYIKQFDYKYVVDSIEEAIKQCL